MSDIYAEVLLVGCGLGATSAARSLAAAGRDVVLVPGISRTRFPHLDGGVVDASLVQTAFGPGAPLGEVVREEEILRLTSGRRFEVAQRDFIEPRVIYRRSALETWAMDRAMRAGARFIDDFIEGKALPNSDGSMTLTSERDERTIRAEIIVLCEGADPRIALRVNLRPDYGPEDQIHFARTVIHGATIPALQRAQWRAGWGMPVDLTIVPQEDGVIVSVAARIENVMRSSRSSKDALEDFLASPAFDSLNIQGKRGETGVELVALRHQPRNIPFVHDRLAIGVDMSGVIDARHLDRADATIRSGLTLARYLLDADLSLTGWPEVAQLIVDEDLRPPASYHDDRGTGFLEEVPAGEPRSVTSRLARLIRRGRPG
jgi:flavin-dependent dehydrogenase